MPAPARMPERPREEKKPAAAAPGPGPAAPAAAGPAAAAGAEGATTAPKPLSKEIIAQQINAMLPGNEDGAQIWSTQLAAERVNDPVLQGRLSNEAKAWSDLIAAWRGGGGAGKDEAFVRQFGSRDVIAVQKFADVEAEQYIEVRGKAEVTAEFYGKIAAAVQTAKTDRARVFPLLQTASAGLTFLGAKIPDTQLERISHRNHGVGSLYRYSLSAAGAAEIDKFATEQVAKETGKTPEEVKAAGIALDETSKLQAMRYLLRTSFAGNPLHFADSGKSLARSETWYSPDQVRVDKADPNVAFTDLMTANALQPEWYADGALALEIEPTGMRDARKPTAFDGMMSSLWMARNQPAQAYGVTGGGAREFLEKGITFAMVKKATAAIPTEEWVTELKRLSALVPKGTTVTEQVLRGQDPGTSATKDMFLKVNDRSQQEAQSPSMAPGQAAPVGASPIAKGGTFDPAGSLAGRTPAHAMGGPTTAPVAAREAPPPPAPRAPGGSSAALPGTGGAGAPGSTAPSSPSGHPGAAPAGAAAPKPAAAAAPVAPAPSAAAIPAADKAVPGGKIAASAQTAPAAPSATPTPAAAKPAEAPAPAQALKPATPAGAAADGDKKPEAAGAPAAAAPAAAPGAAAGAAPVAKPDATSKYASGPAPEGWQSRVAARVPAQEVHADDAGHTYHVLTDGKVVATSKESTVDTSTAAAVRAKAGTTPAPAVTGHDTDLEADSAKVRPTSTLEEFDAMVQSMTALVSAKSKASTTLRITKLKAALGRMRPKLLEVYGPVKGAEYVKSWIDDRLPKANSKPGPAFVSAAQTAKAKLLGKPALNPEDQVDAGWVLSNYTVCAPEEPATDKMIEDSKGIMKVFDVAETYKKGMSADWKAKWIAVYGDANAASTAFTAACVNKGALVAAPPGQESNPAFAGAKPDAVFTNGINGFVGQAKDATDVGSYADAIKRFQLNPGYYPSKSMFVCNAPPSAVIAKKNRGEIQIGKPSVFNLLNFDENVYQENDRQFGRLADPNDATKPGTALELTCQGYPGAEFWPTARILK